ncbi:MAG TPA: hypothetical protein VER36_04580 [Flavisolibacter sp.]|nr:hypothetical protein [Flavisolibacter sp.]
MKPARTSLLLHPLFLPALFLLLVNDFYWKYAYANWLTGKLSDVAGLIVLPVFLRVIFPAASKNLLLAAIALFFAWWKSPLSQPLIDLANQLQLPVARVVDYTDLITLLVLPLPFAINHGTINLHPAMSKSLQWAAGTLTLFSLCATTMPYRSLFQAHPASEEVYFHETLRQKRSLQDVLENLARKGIAYRRDSVMYYPVTNQHYLYYRVQLQGDSTIQWQPVSTAADSVLFVKREGNPYYLIPYYEAGEKKVRNIRFTLSQNKKATKTEITIETFQADGIRSYGYLNNQVRGDFKKLFQQLFQ